MSSKILVNNSASRIEAELSNDEITKFIHKSNKVVNPDKGVVGKIVIINLLTNTDLDLVCRRNIVTSRFPLDVSEGVRYKLEPYPEVEYRMELGEIKYSNMILNRWIMMDQNSNISDKTRYLLAINPITNDEVNCVGYMLLRSIKQ